MDRSVKVAVIGAGVSGLSTARELQREGHQVVVFEKNHRIGGIWVYDPKTDSDPLSIDPSREIVHTSLYRSLRTNLPRPLMGFLDYPFSKEETGDRRTYPGHEEVLRFLDKFAKEFGLHSLIRFNTEVVRVEQVNGEWVVESKTRGLFRNEKRLKRLLSARVTIPNQDSQRFPVVLIIGLGPSGVDISRELAKIAKEVHVVGKQIIGVDLMLENHDNTFYYTNPVEHVQEDGSVTFADGSSIHADAIIHCTGYRYSFPFLETHGAVSVEERWVAPLYKHVFPPSLAPSLAFIGLNYLEAIFHVIELQSKWVAKVLSGKAKLPTEEEMMISIQNLNQLLEEKGFPKEYVHTLQPFQADYKNWLAAQCGLPPVEEWRHDMLLECMKNYFEMRDIRDLWDDHYWDAIIHGASNGKSIIHEASNGK
ncbi:hypothetical protein L6164_023104 [Bauhinia variegata]|uniref:Uncharacterized protein n=1 Tax=Bauhinia variegata TaxID=167791 RepID=A0ACB9MKB4_BAUVA|nr:hypothetical protein L6164_023104 [Bauhinia variegata]